MHVRHRRKLCSLILDKSPFSVSLSLVSNVNVEKYENSGLKEETEDSFSVSLTD
jgi:hypothetical protein